MFIKWREENKPISPERLKELRALSPFGPPKRWKQPPHRWYTYLAESKRVEGKPKQKIIAYLGSIPASTMQQDTEEWRAFWYKVHCSLCLARVDFRTYQTAMRGIGERVKRPSVEDLSSIISDAFEWHPRWHKDYKELCSVINQTDYYLCLR